MKLTTLLTFAFLLPFFGSAQENSGFPFYEPESVVQNYVERPVLLSSPPSQGSFFSAQLSSQPPFPFNPFPDLDIYSFSRGFIFDDRKVDYVALKNEQRAARNLSTSTSDWGAGPSAYNYTTNDLWLEITAVTNDFAYFLLHNTVTNQPYAILTKSDLNWSN